jgi:membrane associated rhomboid family serine protease
MNKFLDWLHADNYPLTRGVIVLTVLLSLAMWLDAPLGAWLGFVAPQSLAQPWTLLTYPLLAGDPIGLLFYCLLLWWFASSLERAWGTRTFAIFFGAMSVISALSLSLGVWLLKLGAIGVFYSLPLAALTVAWCALNPNETIRIYGIIPVLAKWVGVGTALIVFFGHAGIHLLLGFFALASCAASFYWIRARGWRNSFNYAYRAPQPKPAKKKRGPHDDDFSIKDLNPLERWKRARRKKQFQRLFEDEKK